MDQRRIAIIHDWFDIIGGSESVVEQFVHLYPQADLFSLVDFLPPEKRRMILNKPVQTSFIQHLPFARRHFRNYLALMPLAIEQFDLSAYDLVLSSSHAFAKGFIPIPGQIHISYVHTPIRYAWDLQQVYLQNSHLEKGLKSWLTRSILHYLRNWDARTANGIDVIITNSKFTAQRVWKYYHREAEVIYPPVEVDTFELCTEKEDYFLSVSRLVPYKQVQIIVEAFRQLPDQRLVVIGDGPLYRKILHHKSSNVEMVGHKEENELIRYMQRARALIFAAKEDFGIVPVEAQACGTPVIAYGKGGALETVRGLENAQPTGLFFYEQTPDAIAKAVQEFIQLQKEIQPKSCRENALRFDKKKFNLQIKNIVDRFFPKN